MGGSDYSHSLYASKITSRLAKGDDIFTHAADVKAGRAKTVHASLDPKGLNKAGIIVRESVDSIAHPNSRAIAVIFDVTGSMSTIPRTFVAKLGGLMALLVKKGYIQDPHVLFGAVGDATCDSYPLQVGQFEAGNEIDSALTSIVLEGGGGGQRTESYELAMYFMAKKTEMDCLKKRGEKGFLFLLGDETPYPAVKRSEVQAFIGDILEADIPTETILAELREKFEVFWIIPAGTSYFNDEKVLEPLRKLFGQNLLKLDNADDVSELVASTIGVAEGYDLHDVAAALKDIGADGGSIDRARAALVKYADTQAVSKVATATGELATAGAGSGVERL